MSKWLGFSPSDFPPGHTEFFPDWEQWWDDTCTLMVQLVDIGFSADDAQWMAFGHRGDNHEFD